MKICILDMQSSINFGDRSEGFDFASILKTLIYNVPFPSCIVKRWDRFLHLLQVITQLRDVHS